MDYPIWLKAAMWIAFAVAMYLVARLIDWMQVSIAWWTPGILVVGGLLTIWLIDRARAKRGLPPL